MWYLNSAYISVVVEVKKVFKVSLKLYRDSYSLSSLEPDEFWLRSLQAQPWQTLLSNSTVNKVPSFECMEMRLIPIYYQQYSPMHLPLHYLWCWYQLLFWQDTPLCHNELFQLLSAVESANWKRRIYKRKPEISGRVVYVAVQCRNWRSFRRVFRSHHCVQSMGVSELPLRVGLIRALWMHEYLIFLRCACMSPTLNRSSVIRHFERSNAIKTCDGIIFDFYMGLPYMENRLNLRGSVEKGG